MALNQSQTHEDLLCEALSQSQTQEDLLWEALEASLCLGGPGLAPSLWGWGEKMDFFKLQKRQNGKKIKGYILKGERVIKGRGNHNDRLFTDLRRQSLRTGRLNVNIRIKGPMGLDEEHNKVAPLE